MDPELETTSTQDRTELNDEERHLHQVLMSEWQSNGLLRPRSSEEHCKMLLDSFSEDQMVRSKASKIILDVDTGIDDAFALLFATHSKLVELLAVTCVAGNVGVDQVVINTLKTLGNDNKVPVGRGAEGPLNGLQHTPTDYFGKDGFGDLNLPAPSEPAQPVRDAVSLICELVDQYPDQITLVATGPLTNIAKLLTHFPEKATKMHRIVIMGGSFSGGNITKYAEFNIHTDPEAGEIVFNSGIPLTMYPLDAYLTGPCIGREQAQALASRDRSDLELAQQLLLSLPEVNQLPLGDYGALAAALMPKLTKSVTGFVEVVLDGKMRGATVRTADDSRSPVTIITQVDGSRLSSEWLKTLCDAS